MAIEAAPEWLDARLHGSPKPELVVGADHFAMASSISSTFASLLQGPTSSRCARPQRTGMLVRPVRRALPLVLVLVTGCKDLRRTWHPTGNRAIAIENERAGSQDWNSGFRVSTHHETEI